ncbi:hypothetical protein CTEN210_03107 [Chaetoceros tenuissimus]|uniref:Uncharacterized protein n=1 Tax=Chaetoceros tenuissimus TaxID=426638 RepID=A0AAD3CJA1_9STRA|nr:hypothetical protein CTEN210_03107 [Chaetoceros tenuissimus]
MFYRRWAEEVLSITQVTNEEQEVTDDDYEGQYAENSTDTDDDVVQDDDDSDTATDSETPDTSTSSKSTPSSSKPFSSQESYPNRPLLIFKHNPKAGGGSIEELLTELKNNIVKYNDVIRPKSKHSRHPTLPERKKRNRPNKNTQYKNEADRILEAFNTSQTDLLLDDNRHDSTLLNSTEKPKVNLDDLVQRNDTLFVVNEFDPVRPVTRGKGFVISSIREPCDHYLSLWSYGSHGAGNFRNQFRSKRYNGTFDDWVYQAYGKDPPTYDSERDVYAFQYVWLRSRFVKFEIAKRFRKSYGTPRVIQDKVINDPVDCWVYVDNFKATFYTCLKQYENQGGYVNWTAPLLSEMVHHLQIENQKQRNLAKVDFNFTKEQRTKDDPVNSHQLKHHAPCSHYFDNETSNMIRRGRESFIYNIFGYGKCCGKGKPNYALIPPPPLEPEMTTMQRTDKGSMEGNFNNTTPSMQYSNTAPANFYRLLDAIILLLLFPTYYFVAKYVRSRRKNEKYESVSSEDTDGTSKVPDYLFQTRR